MTPREEFEYIVEKYTGRNMEYHVAGRTTGLEFAWMCFNVGIVSAQLDEKFAAEGKMPLLDEAMQRFTQPIDKQPE